MSTEATTGHAARASLRRRLAARAIDAAWLLPAAWLSWRVMSALTELEWLSRAAATAMFVSALQLLVEPLLLATMGATPGKALLGLEVLRSDGRRLSFAAAFGRTLKLVATVLGFWFAPLAALTLPLAAWRLALWPADSAMHWDGHGGSGVVERPRARVAHAALALVGALVPGVVLPLAALFVGLLVIGSQGVDAAQDVSRAVTGRWHWLHRLSGSTLTLDARWRALHDQLWLERAELGTVFAWGAGDGNRVRLQSGWAGATTLEPCVAQRLAMEAEGFLFIEDERQRDGDLDRCRLTGGRPGPGTVVHVRIDGVRGPELDYAIVQTHEDAHDRAREAVLDLGRRLLAEYGRHDVAGGELRSHYWRNDITGVVARLPGDWELSERVLNANGAVSFTFVRSVGKGKARSSTEDAAVMMLPWGVGIDEPDPHDHVANVLARAAQARRLARRDITAGESVSDLENDSGRLHAWSRDRFALTWAAMWRSPPDGPPLATPAQHPLLREVMGTLR